MGIKAESHPEGRGVLASIQDRMARSDRSAKMHAKMLRLTRGTVGSNVQGKAVLLLATTGRRSGLRREVAVMYRQDGSRYLVVPSNASNPEQPPAWWYNLQASPRASILVERGWQDVHAETLSDDEHDRWWPQLIAFNPNWGRYQDQTHRRFPVIALLPQPGPGGCPESRPRR